MATNVLLVGRLGDVLDDVRRRFDRPDVRFFAATGLEEAGVALAG